jgi:hypothetical protein
LIPRRRASHQAFIKTPQSALNAQLKEAAASCQLSINLPDQPRSPREPGLEELIEAADAFN